MKILTFPKCEINARDCAKTQKCKWGVAVTKNAHENTAHTGRSGMVTKLCAFMWPREDATRNGHTAEFQRLDMLEPWVDWPGGRGEG